MLSRNGANMSNARDSFRIPYGNFQMPWGDLYQNHENVYLRYGQEALQDTPSDAPSFCVAQPHFPDSSLPNLSTGPEPGRETSDDNPHQASLQYNHLDFSSVPREPLAPFQTNQTADTPFNFGFWPQNSGQHSPNYTITATEAYPSAPFLGSPSRQKGGWPEVPPSIRVEDFDEAGRSQYLTCSPQIDPSLYLQHLPQYHPPSPSSSYTMNEESSLPSPKSQEPDSPQPDHPRDSISPTPSMGRISGDDLGKGSNKRKKASVPRNAEGKIECTICSDTFDRQCEWGKHMDKHQRPYRCNFSECHKLKGFTYQGGLVRHEREVHGMHGGPKQTLQCPYPFCKRNTGPGFSRKENREEHIRRVHRAALETGRDEQKDDPADQTATITGEELNVPMDGAFRTVLGGSDATSPAPVLAPSQIQISPVQNGPRSKKRKTSAVAPEVGFEMNADLQGVIARLRQENELLRRQNDQKDAHISRLEAERVNMINTSHIPMT